MAGSRNINVGTVFTRVQGLIKGGVLKDVDRPCWYDVMAAFPPRDTPLYRRPIDSRKTIDIVYREDVIRAKFYDTFGNVKPIDICNTSELPVSEKFIAKYNETAKLLPDAEEERLIDAVVEKLSKERIFLKSLEQIKQEIAKKREAAMEARKQLELEAMNAAAQLSKYEAASQEKSRVNEDNEDSEDNGDLEEMEYFELPDDSDKLK